MNNSTVQKSDEDVARCRLCGSREMPRTLYELEQLRVVQCNACKLVYLPMYLERSTLQEMYNEQYFRDRRQYFFDDNASAVEEQMSVSVEHNYSLGLSLIRPLAPGKKLLDLGCAVGTFLSFAKTAGWDASGIDISEYAVSYCRDALGHDVYTGELKNLSFPKGEFDVVTMWDVIEHLNDPISELGEVNRILKMGGLVLVDTPNEDSLLRAIARFLYVATGGLCKYPIRKLYHEFHLYYFNQDTLRSAFAKCGFDVVYIAARGIPIAKGRAGWLERMLVNAVAVPERFLGRGYELIVVARKSRHLGHRECGPSD